MLEKLFPPSVVTVEAAAETWGGKLNEEEEVVVRNALAKRRREFTAGRTCARKALARLGIHGFPLVSSPDRLPVWPPGVIGSISHCQDYAGVAACKEGEILSLGLDIETSEPLRPSLRRMICVKSERDLIDSYSGRVGYALEKVIFSAKESTYKCCYPITLQFLDFGDIEVDLDITQGTYSARFRADLAPRYEALGTQVGRFAVTPSHLFTSSTLLCPKSVSTETVQWSRSAFPETRAVDALGID